MKELNKIYRKRKQQILPLVIGLATFFVIFRVILPQWSDILDAQSLVTTKGSTVSAKEQSVQVLNSISEDKVNNDYDLITTALPVQKDVVLIFTELNDVASKTNVKLGGFTLKVGDVYSQSKVSGSKTSGAIGFPSLKIMVNVAGQSDNLRKFADELYKSVPLVEIGNIDIGSNNASLDVSFYYKPVTTRPQTADTTALKDLSSADNAQLDKLRSWKEAPITSQ